MSKKVVIDNLLRQRIVDAYKKEEQTVSGLSNVFLLSRDVITRILKEEKCHRPGQPYKGKTKENCIVLKQRAKSMVGLKHSSINMKRVLTNEQMEVVCKKYNEGWSDRDIQKIVGIGKLKLWEAFEKLGINWKSVADRNIDFTNINVVDVVYLAGFVDGEGYIGFSSHLVQGKKTHQARIIVSNTNREILEWIVGLFGGRIEEKVRINSHWKTGYQWCVSSIRALKVLKIIYPFLKIKKKQAEIIFMFYDMTIDGKRTTDERRQLREELNVEIKKLNKKGSSQCAL